MDERRVEELLQRRAREGARPLLSPARERAVRAQLAAEAGAAGRGPRRRWWIAAGLAAGLALVLAVSQLVDRRSSEPLLAGVELLDGRGRPWERRLRGAGLEASTPTSLIVQLTAREAAQALVALYDGDGALRWLDGPEPFHVAEGQPVLRRYDLAAPLAEVPGDGPLILVVLLARGQLAGAELARIARTWPGGEPAAVAAELARRLGCDVHAERLTRAAAQGE